MSLINEALKKAERERALEQAEGTAPPHGGRTRVSKRGAPMKTQTVLTIVAGALLLVVVSAVLTGVFVTRSVEPKPTAAKPAVAPVPASSAAASPAPVLILANIPAPPNSQRPAAGAAVVPGPGAVPLAGPDNTLAASAAAIVANLPAVGSAEAAAPPPAPAEPASVAPSGPPLVQAAPAAPGSSAPAVTAAHAPAVPPPAAMPRHDARIQALVDGFHVTGIRSNGTDSKVLMNERVFRVNDIVDYGFGLKLTTVAPDRLTFVDAGGETYVKNF